MGALLMCAPQIGYVLVVRRYLTDHVESLSLGVLSRLVRVNDTLMALVPLLSKAPWQRRHATHFLYPNDLLRASTRVYSHVGAIGRHAGISI